MKSAYVMSTAFAVVVAATSLASAQALRDDPPGSLFQDRGIVEDLNGGVYRGYYYDYGRQYNGSRTSPGARGALGDYASDPRYRNLQRDSRPSR